MRNNEIAKDRMKKDYEDLIHNIRDEYEKTNLDIRKQLE